MTPALKMKRLIVFKLATDIPDLYYDAAAFPDFFENEAADCVYIDDRSEVITGGV